MYIFHENKNLSVISIRKEMEFDLFYFCVCHGVHYSVIFTVLKSVSYELCLFFFILWGVFQFFWAFFINMTFFLWPRHFSKIENNVQNKMNTLFFLTGETVLVFSCKRKERVYICFLILQIVTTVLETMVILNYHQ